MHPIIAFENPLEEIVDIVERACLAFLCEEPRVRPDRPTVLVQPRGVLKRERGVSGDHFQEKEPEEEEEAVTRFRGQPSRGG